MTAQYTRNALMLVGGVGVLVTTAQLVKIYHWLFPLPPQTEDEQNHSTEKSLKLEYLAELVNWPSVEVRRSAEQLLLDRVMKNEVTLDLLVSWCMSKDLSLVEKGVTVMCVLVKSVDLRKHPKENEFLSTLTEVLINTSSLYHQQTSDTGLSEAGLLEKIQKLAICGLFEVICDGESQKMYMVEHHEDIVGCVLTLVTNSQSKEVLRYGLFIAHQLTVQDSTRNLLMEYDGLRCIAMMIVRNHGDPILQRISLQILVVFLTACDLTVLKNEAIPKDTKAMLSEIVHQGALVPVVVCLRSEDPECTYWALALLHEFVVNEMYKEEICSVFGLLRSLAKTLSASDASIQRLILRLTCFLCLQNDDFKREVLNSRDLIKRLPVCFASSERDIAHWCLVLVHDLAFMGKSSVERLLEFGEGLMPSMVSMVHNHGDIAMKRLMAETLGFFCSNEHLLLRLVSDGLLTTILNFASHQDSELQFWASAMLLNMAMTSDEMKFEILKSGGLAVLMELVIAEHENTQIAVMAAKSLSMLGHTDQSLSVHLVCDGDNCRLAINDSIYHLNKPGLNILIWSTLSSSEVMILHYDVKNAWEVKDTKIVIPYKQHDEGNLVVISVRGPLKQAWLRAMRDVLLFQEESQIPLKGRYDLTDEDQCILLCTMAPGGRLAVSFLEKALEINTQCRYPYGEVVNQRVTDIAVVPTVKILFSTPPSSPISKVAELELLEIFARHFVLKETLLTCDGFVEYLSSIIVSFNELFLSQDIFTPIQVAHCLGVLRTLSVLSIYETCQGQLIDKGVIIHIIMLLYHLTGSWINSILDSQEGLGSPNELSESYTWESPIPSPTKPRSPLDSLSDLDINSHQLGVDQKAEEPSKVLQPNSAKESSGINPDFMKKVVEYEELLSSLARFAILVLSNCAESAGSNKEVLAEMGCVHMIWSVLLCCGSVLKSHLALPISTAMTSLACPGKKSNGNMILNRHHKTPALLLSSDQLQVRNDNWTFESISGNQGIKLDGSSLSDKGWYYEVTLKSSGIIQIGWCNEMCVFGPEKGLGVGDDVNSCSFDGERCKIWNGPASINVENDYGSQWGEGDVVSCLMSQSGDVSYWLKGSDLGVAFKGLRRDVTWYPAVSLSTDQQVKFNFGSSHFRYEPPIGYKSLHSEFYTREIPATNSFNEHVLFVRDLLPPLSDSDRLPIPSLYYETTVTLDTDFPFVYGLRTVTDELAGSSKVSCSINHDSITLSDDTQARFGPLESLPLTLGCGLVLPQGAIFFTVNGRPIKSLHSFPNSEDGHKPLVPYLSSNCVDCNFGDSYFFYTHANQKEHKLGMAALLHDYHEVRWMGQTSP